MKLDNTQQVVNMRLDNAVVELDKAVADAEQKIKDQVAEVSFPPRSQEFLNEKLGQGRYGNLYLCHKSTIIS